LALPQFKQDRMLRQAVERNFEIIGEAIRRLEKDDPETAAASPITAGSSRFAMC
jgi:uncharacterized protein with HEPN domain